MVALPPKLCLIPVDKLNGRGYAILTTNGKGTPTMLVQSKSGKVYAVIAHNSDFEISVMPMLVLVSTTVMVHCRFRFKDLKRAIYDPMNCPKLVLTGGVERSKDTLRGELMLNTGIKLELAPKAFPTVAGLMLQDAVIESLLGDETGVWIHNVRTDFIQDFAKLLTAQWASMYPAKNYASLPRLMTATDLEIHKNGLPSDDTGPDLSVASDNTTDGNLIKLPFGHAGALNKGVDEQDAGVD